jgi:hypothetical protein
MCTRKYAYHISFYAQQLFLGNQPLIELGVSRPSQKTKLIHGQNVELVALC